MPLINRRLFGMSTLTFQICYQQIIQYNENSYNLNKYIT